MKVFFFQTLFFMKCRSEKKLGGGDGGEVGGKSGWNEKRRIKERVLSGEEEESGV